MPRPPITKKPIPKTPAIWRREVDGLIKYRKQLAEMEIDNGKQWVDAMDRHSVKRLADLYDNRPKGAKCPRGFARWRSTLSL